MVRVFNVYYPKRTLQLVVVECLLVVFSLFGVALLHFGSGTLAVFRAEFGYLKIGLVAATCMFFLYHFNLYTPGCLRGLAIVSDRFLRSLGVSAIILAFLYYVFPTLELYRGFAVTGISLTIVLLLSNRTVFSIARRSQKRLDKVMILGDAPIARLLAKVIHERTELGFSLLGYLGNRWTTVREAEMPPRLGGVQDLADVAEELKPDRLIVAMRDRRSKLPVDELLQLKTSGVVVQDAADFYEIATGKLPVESVRLSWLIFSPGFKASKLTLVYKRIISVILALFGLVLLAPLMGLIAVAIRLDSPGPIIFRQRRIGWQGHPFTLFKFRTMHINADRGGYAKPVEQNDQRITRVGRRLRRFRLDEIPQLFNILAGQMNFVGPRPFVPEQEIECASQIPLYSHRWSVRPGATGWAQVQRGYCASLEDNIDKLSYDLFYIKNMSIGLDLLILFKTIKIVLSAEGGR